MQGSPWLVPNPLGLASEIQRSQVSCGAKVQPRHLKVLRCGLQMARSFKGCKTNPLMNAFTLFTLLALSTSVTVRAAKALTLLLSVCLERLSSLLLDPPTDSKIQECPHCKMLRNFGEHPVRACSPPKAEIQDELAKACAPQLGGIDPKVDAMSPGKPGTGQAQRRVAHSANSAQACTDLQAQARGFVSFALCHLCENWLPVGSARAAGRVAASIPCFEASSDTLQGLSSVLGTRASQSERAC